MLKRTVVFHHPASEGAAATGRRFAAALEARGVEAFVCSAWDDTADHQLERSGLIVAIGGDGTVLRAARVARASNVPVLGVNMGNLGFLTELNPDQLFESMDRIVEEDWRIEQRMMVRADVVDAPGAPTLTYHGLNDIFISRRLPGRPIYVALRIDGAHVANYRCDGIIVASPTGSTGYSLSAGGPILAPTEHHLVVTPVSAHMALGRSLVLEESSTVELRATSEHGAILSVDGQEDVAVTSGVRVTIGVSEHVVRFVRFRPPSTFYAELAEKLEFQLSSAMGPRA